jgi:hypothetical protein
VWVVASGQRNWPSAAAVHIQEPLMGDVPARTFKVFPFQVFVD